MGKINEFINNGNGDLLIEFDKLSKQLYYETSHLSAFNEIEKNENYQKILSHGDKIVPILIDKILSSICSINYYIILSEICGGINITDGNEGNIDKMRDDYKVWWDLNKDKYGK